jgi:hypothetical protein
MHRPSYRQFLSARTGAAVAIVGLFTTGCPADDGDATGTAATTGDASGSPTTDPDSISTLATVTETATDPDPTTTMGDTDPTTDTADPTSDTSAAMVVECPTPGTMLWEGDIYIDSVEDMALLEGYAEIEGDVRIFEPAIDSLDFMACITSVGGNIQVFGTTAPNIAGLGNLTTLGGSLSVSENPNLVEVYGFDGLAEIGGAVIITKNASLTGIFGFDGLGEIKLGINIDENPILTQVAGFDNLVAVGTDTADAPNYPDLSIAYNPELVSIDGPIGIKALGGQLVIQANPKLCISDVQALADMLEQWVQEGMGDTTGNNNNC